MISVSMDICMLQINADALLKKIRNSTPEVIAVHSCLA